MAAARSLSSTKILYDQAIFDPSGVPADNLGALRGVPPLTPLTFQPATGGGLLVTAQLGPVTTVPVYLDGPGRLHQRDKQGVHLMVLYPPFMCGRRRPPPHSPEPEPEPEPEERGSDLEPKLEAEAERRR